MKKENTRPILSISLLCSGRNKDEMIKTLESLLTIRNRMSSEIVIVDTGCGPDTKPLLQKYADKVIEFTWSDDFAKARNAGLEQCIGEWFMFIDDDEWFENTDAIVDFFNSGRHQEYGRAQYIIRNYTNFEGTAYADAWSERIVRHVDGLAFHGKIHEYMEPTVGRRAKLDCFVHHYGYVYKDKEGIFKKAQRNIPLLLEMIKEEPNGIHWRAQLIQEYRNVHDYSSMENLCLSSLDRLEKSEDISSDIFRGHFYEGILIAELETYQYDEAVANVNKFLSDNRNSEKCNSGLCFYAVEAYWNQKKYQKVFTYAQRYLESYDKFRKIEDTSIDDMTFMCGNIFDRNRILYCISRVIFAGVRCGDISSLHDYFNRFDLTYHLEPIIPFCEGVTYAFTHFDFDDRFVDYAEKMCTHQYLRSLLVKEASDIEKKNTRSFNKLVDIYGVIDNSEDPYLIYLKIRYAHNHRHHDELIDLYIKYFTYVVGSLDKYDGIWKIADEEQLDFHSIIKSIPFRRWKQDVDLLFEKKHKDSKEIISMLSGRIDGDGDIRFEYFRLKTKEIHTADAKESEAAALLIDYCNSCVNFYLGVYRAELFTGDLTVLPDECRFAMSFVNAVGTQASCSPVEYIHRLEESAAIYTPFTNVMKLYMRDYGNRKRAELLKKV